MGGVGNTPFNRQADLPDTLANHFYRIKQLEANPGGGLLSWVPIPLSNGWTPGFVVPAYARDKAGVVHLRGNATPGVFNNAIGVLPPGSRPTSYQVQFPGAFRALAQVEVDDTDGSIYVYDFFDESIGTGFSSGLGIVDDGSFTGSGFKIGVMVTNTTTLKDLAFTPYLITGITVGGDIELAGHVAHNGFALVSTGYGIPVYAVERWIPPHADVQVSITVVTAAILRSVSVAARVQQPFISDPSPTYPFGLMFTVEPTVGGGADLILGNGVDQPITTLASGVSPGLNDGDVVSIVVVGESVQGYVNNTLVVRTSSNVFPGNGHAGFGFDVNTANASAVTDFSVTWPDDDKHPPSQQISLDGITFEGQ